MKMTRLGTAMLLGALFGSRVAAAQDGPAKAPAQPAPEKAAPAKAAAPAKTAPGTSKKPTPAAARVQSLGEKLAVEDAPGSDGTVWERLRGSSIRERILALEAFVREHPEHNLSAVLYEEATLLRELAGHRLALGQRPPAPAHTRIDIPTTDDSAAPREPASEPEVEGELDSAKEPAKECAPPGAAPPAQVAPNETPVPALAKTAPGPDIPSRPNAPANARKHDGGYLHFAFGPSWLRGKYTGALLGCKGCTYGESVSDAKLGGNTMNAEMALGWSLADGVVLGARGVISVINGWSFDGGVATNGPEVNGSPSILLTAAGLLDWYPMPAHGLHVFVSPGYITGKIADSDGRLAAASMRGIAVGTGIGYEGWVSDEWSIGLQGRVDMAWLSRESGEVQTEKLSIVSPGLQFTFTYN